MDGKIEQFAKLKADLIFNKTADRREVMEQLEITDEQYLKQIYKALWQQEYRAGVYDAKTWKVFRFKFYKNLYRFD